MEKCGIIFVDSALVTMLALMKFSSKMYKNDESELLKIVIPSLFVSVMVTLTKYSAELVKKHTTVSLFIYLLQKVVHFFYFKIENFSLIQICLISNFLNKRIF